MKVLIMVDDGVEESEFLYPLYRFQEAGYQVDVVASKAKTTYTGKHGMTITSELSPRDINVDDYDLLIIPGGRGPDLMRTDEGMVAIVKQFYAKAKVIAAICHGPQMLIEADILRGKKATCWKSVSTDLKNAGGNFVDAAVVTDGKLITSRMPADLPKFCQEALSALKKK